MKPFINDCLNILNKSGTNPINKSVIRNVIAFLLLTNLTVQTAVSLLVDWKGRDSFKGFTDLILSWQLMVKLVILIVNHQKTAKLVNDLNYFWPIDKWGLTTQRKIEKLHKFTKQFIRCSKILYFLTALSYMLTPVFERKRVFFMPAYLPKLNITESPTYEIIYILQCCTCSLTAYTVLGFDLLFICIILHVVCEIKLIKKAFASTISETSYNYENSLEIMKGLINRHNNVLRLRKTRRKNKSINLESSLIVAVVVNYRYLNDVNNYYSIVIINQFASSTVMICGGLFVLTNDSFFANTTQNIGYIISIATFVGQLFFYCAGGSYIMTESESIGNSVYEMSWWLKTQPRLRRAMVLSIQRSNKATRLTAGGILNVDLNSFRALLRTAFSFFTLIRAVYSKSEEH